MHLPSLIKEEPLDMYKEINLELEDVKKGYVLPEKIHYMAQDSLPAHEADLIDALFEDFPHHVNCIS